MWQSEPESLVDSLVELTRFNNTASSDDEDITIRGCNVRELIAATIRPLLGIVFQHSTLIVKWRALYMAPE